MEYMGHLVVDAQARFNADVLWHLVISTPSTHSPSVVQDHHMHCVRRLVSTAEPYYCKGLRLSLKLLLDSLCHVLDSLFGVVDNTSGSVVSVTSLLDSK
jgi:hypothetical protein